ncbi:peptidylprolyl isomerase [Kangiella geojedonensis]|uniref:peptidylprolyl isomerase n=1 Tax=Kangiella geojedonensis TaxID=914150 RepID=A0A0F6RBT6_9GAMM|nr:peptidylprolyl isomerase [Kangiella geojedonensis]AKE51446.1 peptidylprolyl isomerase [Kangiella geojedonensis]
MKHGYLLVMGLVLASFAGQGRACVHPNDIYYWADMRDAQHYQFDEALNCDDLPLETLETTLVSLGRIGGEETVGKITPYLQHDNSQIRYAAAFALEVAKVPSAGSAIVKALNTEQDPDVQYRLALSLGNMAYVPPSKADPGAQQVLTQIINHDDSTQKIRGAIHGLMILATFYRDQIKSFDHEGAALDIQRILTFLRNQETQLETSYLLARTSLLDSDNLPEFLEALPDLAPTAKANLIRALATTKQRQILPTLIQHLDSEHIGVRVNAIRSLANFPSNPVASATVLQALAYDDVISQVTALKTIKKDWLQSSELLENVKAKLQHSNSWIQSEAMQALIRADKGSEKLAEQWLESKDPNHQRASIAYFVQQKQTERLKALAKSEQAIIANGAKKALTPEPETANEASKTDDALPQLPAIVELETTKGIITIELFADTPYTSANFIELIDNGFYNDTYFHRVIPNFVVQGGSKVGDGTGNVDYSIREELSYRSHLPGTVGMATLGKDTGGAQFFINTAPNIHLDSNYTIFGKVIDGMGVAIKLEQNDKVIKAKTLTRK